MRLAELPAVLPGNKRNWVQVSDGASGTRRHTFAEIDAATRPLAGGLLARLADRPPARATVAISGPTGLDWLLTALACLYLGAEIVAVPESLPLGEQQRLAAECGAHVLVDVGERHTAQVAVVPTVTVAELADTAGPPPEVFPASAFRAVAFTSGSSSHGVKAFRITAQATESFVTSFADLFGLRATDSWAICHPFSHIVHLEYALGGLRHGYNLTLTTPMRVMLGKLDDTPAVLVSVPSVYQAMADLIRKRLPGPGLKARLLGAWLAAPVTDLTRRLAPWVSRVLAPGAVAADWSALKVAIIGTAPSGAQLQRFLILMGLPMYEGYGMSETQMLACNVPGRSRFGTVGPAWPGVALRRSAEGELLVRLDHPRTRAYLDDQGATAATFGADGWIRTGDVAQVTDGYWSIVGRTKSTIVLSHGKNVNPESIERRLDDIAGVRASLVSGDRRPNLVALLVIREGLRADQRASVRQGVYQVNDQLPHHERIVDCLLLDEDDVPENIFTRSGKLRRAVVAEHFADRLDALHDRSGRGR